MPELPSEGEANPCDVLKYSKIKQKLLAMINIHLLAGITFVQHGVQVAGLAEELVLEDHIVQSYSLLAYRALQTILMPGKYLP